jgi:septation ring formation regulator
MLMWDDILIFFAQQQVLLVLIGLFSFLMMLLIVRRWQRGKVAKRLSALEVTYNKSKSVPLTFKLNKAIALSKANQDLDEVISNLQQQYKEIDEQLKQISQNLADIEDSILLGRLKQADAWIEDTNEMLTLCESAVSKLDQQLASILEDETQQRTEITKLKDEFRICKATLANESQSLSLSMQVLSDEVADIEKMFTSFEEWMFASEFEKAKEKAVEIETSIAALQGQLKHLPELIALTKGHLPTLIDEVSHLYNQLKQRGVHVDHLDVTRNLELISNTLKDDLSQLRNGIYHKVDDHCSESQKRLLQLKKGLEHEGRSFDESNQLMTSLNDTISQNTNDYEALKKDYDKYGVRYGLKQAQAIVETTEKTLIDAKETASRLQSLLKDNKVPATTIGISIKEALNDMQKLQKELVSQLNQFQQAKNDEARAQKQLLKLHLIVNEIQVKIRKHRLPAISDSYQGDLHKSKQMTQTIHSILENDPLDTRRLNTLVNESIDFIYKLYNNVNNIVGMVDMIEHGVVFANKYRSSLPSMDSELTRTELSFRNGEYTQALSIVLGAIERLHPDSFEQLVKENAKSASGV